MLVEDLALILPSESAHARATGFPVASVSEQGALPAGVRLAAAKNGQATISGIEHGEGENGVSIPGLRPRVSPTAEAVACASDPERNLSPTPLTLIGDVDGVGDTPSGVDGVGDRPGRELRRRQTPLSGGGRGPGPHWVVLADWVLFAANITGNNTQ